MELAGHECVGFCEFDKYAVMSYTAMHLCTQEQLDYLATLPLKQRQKEILKDEYKNGEWYANDVRRVDARDIPEADCWCFGFPCQDISVAGKGIGFNGKRSSLFFEVMRLLDEREANGLSRPGYLFIENVKNLLSVNRGGDFAKVLFALDERGFDAEWQVLNSKNFGVPQNRERVFVVGHLRGRSTAEVFPVEGADGTHNIQGVIQVGLDGKSHRNNPNQYRVYDSEGVSPCLNQMGGGGREPHIIDTKYRQKVVDVYDAYNKNWVGGDTCGTLTTNSMTSTTHSGTFELAFELATDKNSNQGIFGKVLEDLTVYAVWYPKKQRYVAIRKLTPKECFRLQGWTDDYFEKAEFVNSNSQLYKQAGNGVTVCVVEEIAKRMHGYQEDH